MPFVTYQFSSCMQYSWHVLHLTLSLPSIPICSTPLRWIYYQLPSWFKLLICAHYVLSSNFISTNRALKNQWIWNLPWKIWTFHLIKFCSNINLYECQTPRSFQSFYSFFFLFSFIFLSFLQYTNVASKKRDPWYELCYHLRWFILIMKYLYAAVWASFRCVMCISSWRQ